MKSCEKPVEEKTRCNKRRREGLLGQATCSAASPERKMHLIKVIRVWLNRAEEYTEDGKPWRASDAIDHAGKALNILESLCR